MSYREGIFLAGGTLTAVQPSLGALISPVNNEIFVLGGSNMNTAGSGNTVTVNVDSSIVIDSANMGESAVSVNDIASMDTGEDIVLGPQDNGKIQIPYATSNSIAFLGSTQNILSTSALSNGQIAIGSTGSNPVANTLTAGTGVTIQNSAGAITISSTGSTGKGGAFKWEMETYTGTEQRTFTTSPNMGLIANSSVVGPPPGPGYDFVASSPIIWNIDSVDDWEVGDGFWVLNRNLGNYQVTFPLNVSVWYTYYTHESNMSLIFSTTASSSAMTSGTTQVTTGKPLGEFTGFKGTHVASQYFTSAFVVYFNGWPSATAYFKDAPPTMSDGSTGSAFVIVDYTGASIAIRTNSFTNFTQYQ